MALLDEVAAVVEVMQMIVRSRHKRECAEPCGAMSTTPGPVPCTE